MKNILKVVTLSLALVTTTGQINPLATTASAATVLNEGIQLSSADKVQAKPASGKGNTQKANEITENVDDCTEQGDSTIDNYNELAVAIVAAAVSATVALVLAIVLVLAIIAIAVVVTMEVLK